jgi:hypothetical protein
MTSLSVTLVCQESVLPSLLSSRLVSKSAVLAQINGAYLTISCPLSFQYDPNNFNIFYLKI